MCKTVAFLKRKWGKKWGSTTAVGSQKSDTMTVYNEHKNSRQLEIIFKT